MLSSLPEPDLGGLEAELKKAERVIITTGFPVFTGESCICETDGPLGASDMACAFAQTGAEVVIVSDEVSSPQVLAASKLRVPEAKVAVLGGNEADFARELLSSFAPTHIIALERPGKAADGHYHNSRGKIIDFMVKDTDTLFALAMERGAVSIGIGDGGNELGMGNHFDIVAANVPMGGTIAARLCSDYALVSGVSNWWGLGIAAMLSLIHGRDLLPSDAEETALLRATVDAGAVDGITKRAEMTVDNLPLAKHLEILRALRSAVADGLAR